MTAAVEAGDVEEFMATLSPAVVLRSPISDRAEFRGHDDIRQLMEAVFATIEDIRYYLDLGDETNRALFYRGRIGNRWLEEACLVSLDAEARIDEFTLWIRPLPGLTRLAAGLGPRLARRGGRGRAALVAAAARPLASLTAAADGPLVRLVTRR
jgi:hypothetical protein